VTFTTDDLADVSSKVSRFADRLQTIDQNLPLRLVPLRVDAFTPTTSRLNHSRMLAMRFQEEVVRAWSTTVDHLFPAAMRELSINKVPLREERRG
jgi:hypothetical protein